MGKKLFTVMIVATMAAAAAGCETTGEHTKRGAIGGGALGAVAGVLWHMRQLSNMVSPRRRTTKNGWPSIRMMFERMCRVGLALSSRIKARSGGSASLAGVRALMAQFLKGQD